LFVVSISKHVLITSAFT